MYYTQLENIQILHCRRMEEQRDELARAGNRERAGHSGGNLERRPATGARAD